MNFQLIIHPNAEGEIYDQADEYGNQFSSGEEDFIMAISDTLEQIESHPYLGSSPLPRIDKLIKKRGVQANPKSKSFAKKFPFALVYKIYESSNRIMVYQLWPTKSGRQIRIPPNK